MEAPDSSQAAPFASGDLVVFKGRTYEVVAIYAKRVLVTAPHSSSGVTAAKWKDIEPSV